MKTTQITHPNTQTDTHTQITQRPLSLPDYRDALLTLGAGWTMFLAAAFLPERPASVAASAGMFANTAGLLILTLYARCVQRAASTPLPPLQPVLQPQPVLEPTPLPAARQIVDVVGVDVPMAFISEWCRLVEPQTGKLPPLREFSGERRRYAAALNNYLLRHGAVIPAAGNQPARVASGQQRDTALDRLAA